jgi:hypothetical protein
MPVPKGSMYTLAEGILACVCTALDEARAEDNTLPGCPCRTFVAPGARIAWDCSDGSCGTQCAGQLTVHFENVTLADSANGDFRTGSVVQKGRSCNVSFVRVEFVVTLLRCVPVAYDTGQPPEAADLADAAYVQMADAETILAALQCCVPGLAAPGHTLRYTLGAGRTIGPEGGCAGVEQRVTVAIPGCACPATGNVPDPVVGG